MKRLAVLLLLVGTPAFAADQPVIVLRGSSAPPTPWYEPPAPPPPPPQPVVVYQPVIYPPYFYGLPVRQHRRDHSSANGWPLFRR